MAELERPQTPLIGPRAYGYQKVKLHIIIFQKPTSQIRLLQKPI